MAYLLGSMFEKAKFYSASEVEYIIKISIKKSILKIPNFSPNHLRMAMVDNKIMLRNHKEQYWISETYNGYGLKLFTNTNGIEEKQIKFPQEKIKCPLCLKRAYPYIILKHFKKEHQIQYNNDINFSSFVEDNCFSLLEKYFDV